MAQKSTPQAPHPHANYGLSVARKNPKLAEHHYREALRLNPNHIYANINLGLLLIRQKKQTEGVALLKKVVALNPNWALAHYWLSRGLRDLRQSKESLVERRLTSLNETVTRLARHIALSNPMHPDK